MAIAHVPAQAQDIADCQRQLYASQQFQAQQQQLYTESRVQQARDEAEQRSLVFAETIRSTQIDPMAIGQHVNIQLQSAIAAANDLAEAQTRAGFEAQTLQHAHKAGVRMPETFQRVQDQFHASMEQRIQDVLKAHREQGSVEIRLAIAAQDQEILKAVKEQIKAVKKDNTTQMEQEKSTAEKTAKSIVRRHYAEENAAHEKLEARLFTNNGRVQENDCGYGSIAWR
ncbi:hypothetical protein AM587_10011129 [Phytophthora nicotianae]|uniref:Uncharacterized protein n=1 Tax=Phytophthora nicotianae TaxID=4792 RepID=A0A0W8D3E8_PHYNI|nr:hypothetical protein AM587_10011129 [Phytophthora nicotianae]